MKERDIFIYYAHENEDELKLVVEHLRLLRVVPRWSGTLQAGSPFPGQIEEYPRMSGD